MSKMTQGVRNSNAIDPRYSGQRVRVAWEYLQPYFESKEEFVNFLRTLGKDKLEKFLYSMHFYHSHDVFRDNAETFKRDELAIYSYLLTLSVVESLMSDYEGQWKRINLFFDVFLSAEEKEILNSKIENRKDKSRSAVRILYEMRNEFVHSARWFHFHNGDGFGTLKKVKNKSNNYYVIIKFSRDDYLEIFWKAFLRYFQKDKFAI